MGTFFQIMQPPQDASDVSWGVVLAFVIRQAVVAFLEYRGRRRRRRGDRI